VSCVGPGPPSASQRLIDKLENASSGIGRPAPAGRGIEAKAGQPSRCRAFSTRRRRAAISPESLHVNRPTLVALAPACPVPCCGPRHKLSEDRRRCHPRDTRMSCPRQIVRHRHVGVESSACSSCCRSLSRRSPLPPGAPFPMRISSGLSPALACWR